MPVSIVLGTYRNISSITSRGSAVRLTILYAWGYTVRDGRRTLRCQRRGDRCGRPAADAFSDSQAACLPVPDRPPPHSGQARMTVSMIWVPDPSHTRARNPDHGKPLPRQPGTSPTGSPEQTETSTGAQNPDKPASPRRPPCLPAAPPPAAPAAGHRGTHPRSSPPQPSPGTSLTHRTARTSHSQRTRAHPGPRQHPAWPRTHNPRR
jgi:hypothetical protein